MERKDTLLHDWDMASAEVGSWMRTSAATTQMDE